jgi:hypothetical protein
VHSRRPIAALASWPNVSSNIGAGRRERPENRAAYSGLAADH